MNTITKPELIDKLRDCPYIPYSDKQITKIADFIMPDFIPRKGQLISVWNDFEGGIITDRFREMDYKNTRGYVYICELDNWKNARPLTLEDIS